MKPAQVVLSAVTAALLNGSTTLGDQLDATSDVNANIHHHHDHHNEASYIRSYFYAGGQYVEDGSGDFTFQDQLYVERLVPSHGISHDTPIVLIHGQGQTGTNFLNKPDGGEGWASQFIRQGYEVYILDQTYRGRSPWVPSDNAAGYGASIAPPFTVSRVQQFFTATRDYLLWPQAVNHTQWPGTGKKGDPIFDAFYAANVQFLANETYQQVTVQQAGAALLDRIGKPVILLGHSQGSNMPLLIADARPNLSKALILVEPTGPPFQEVLWSNPGARAWGLSDAPMIYSPAVHDPNQDLVREEHAPPSPSSQPILLVTGEASYHARYDYCTVKFLQQAGCSKTEHLDLGKVGEHGNGHFIFLEKNSKEVQLLLKDWIAKL
ncbi:putative secreted lipase [Cladobotryum mycophilum]|uniref:Secreted lipase n=1 Tax=Cladobotryum mycophilum TaxID=491253 RepID=A0ABR0T047_9HYPO